MKSFYIKTKCELLEFLENERKFYWSLPLEDIKSDYNRVYNFPDNNENSQHLFSPFDIFEEECECCNFPCIINVLENAILVNCEKEYNVYLMFEDLEIAIATAIGFYQNGYNVYISGRGCFYEFGESQELPTVETFTS